MEEFSKSKTYALIKKAQAGDKSAKETLTDANMRLVFHCAQKFYDRGYEKEELHQVGAIGLIKAIDKFNADYDVCFSTYAVPMILGEIKRFLRDDGPIKVSREIKRTAAESARIVDEIQKKEGRTPGIKEIAELLNSSPEEIVRAREAMIPPESFFLVRPNGTKSLADTLPANEDTDERLRHLDLKTAVEALPAREKNIIIMRYFLEKTQSEVAKKLGISQVQVSRLEKKILADFRKNLQCEVE